MSRARWLMAWRWARMTAPCWRGLVFPRDPTASPESVALNALWSRERLRAGWSKFNAAASRQSSATNSGPEGASP